LGKKIIGKKWSMKGKNVEHLDYALKKRGLNTRVVPTRKHKIFGGVGLVLVETQGNIC
jgi:hypothetical protein